MHTDDLLRHDVCRLFTEGLSLTKIPDEVAKLRGTQLIPNDVYRLLREAALNRHLHYNPQSFDAAARFLRAKLDECEGRSLREVSVLCPSVDAVATATANAVYRRIIDRLNGGQFETHIAVCAGVTVSRVIDKLYSLLLYPSERLQEIESKLRERHRSGDNLKIRLCFHSIVPMFDPSVLHLSPNAALLIFTRQEFRELHGDTISITAVGAPAPPLKPWAGSHVQSASRESLRNQIKQSHIVITSASSIGHKKSMLQRFYSETNGLENVRPWLREKGCIGNMMVFPLKADGPFSDAEFEQAKIGGRTDLPIFPNTLIRPHELPEFIASGADVFLAMPTRSDEVSQHADVRQIIEMCVRHEFISHLFCSVKTAYAFGWDTPIQHADYVNQGVARHFTDGLTPGEIHEKFKGAAIPQAGLRKGASGEVTRQGVYKVLDRDDFHHEIVYRCTPYERLADKLEKRFHSLQSIFITKSNGQDVAALLADHAYRLVTDRVMERLDALEKSDAASKDACNITVSLGFAGGRGINLAIEAFYHKLLIPDETMGEIHLRLRSQKRKIHLELHSLLPMVDPYNLGLSPTGSLVHFKNREFYRHKNLLKIKTFGVKDSLDVELEGPGERLMSDEKLREAAKNLDIVMITACGIKRSDHLLRFVMSSRRGEVPPEAEERFRADKIVGSSLLHPIAEGGFVSPEKLHEWKSAGMSLHVNSLLTPFDLKAMQARGSSIVLMLSGDIYRQEDKEHAEIILRQECDAFRRLWLDGMITHAFLGDRIAEQLLEV